MLHRVLGSQHDEGLGQRVGDAVDGQLPLLHGLQQAGLGLGAGAVDLVRQDDLGHQAPEAHLPLPRLGVEGRIARHVGGQQVGGELYAGEGAVEGPGQGRDQGGLPQAGHVLDEHMPPADQSKQKLLRLLLLPHDHFRDIFLDLFHQREFRHRITALLI